MNDTSRKLPASDPPAAAGAAPATVFGAGVELKPRVLGTPQAWLHGGRPLALDQAPDSPAGTIRSGGWAVDPASAFNVDDEDDEFGDEEESFTEEDEDEDEEEEDDDFDDEDDDEDDEDDEFDDDDEDVDDEEDEEDDFEDEDEEEEDLGEDDEDVNDD